MELYELSDTGLHVQDRWETRRHERQFCGVVPGYHPCSDWFLTCSRDPAGGQCRQEFDWGGRLRKVSEALKGSLRMVGNHSKSAKAEGSLTATPTGGAGTKVGLSDPVVLSGNAIAQRIKATLGITG